MGLDYCFRDGKVKELPEEEYLKIYAGADLPNTDYYKVQADGKKIIRYPLDFMDSRRRDLAILEHLRWNSFMISKGMIPATIEQIKEEQILKDGKLKFTNGKNYRLRRHGNLTTFDGLIEFRRIVSARDHQSELSKDVIKYDYQALDDAYWFLQKAGHIIYKIK